MSEYKYDASMLDMGIKLAKQAKDKVGLSDDYIRGLEVARSLLRTEEEDRELIETIFRNFSE